MSVENLTRSVLFEIVDVEGRVEESFTLVIPPMSWSVREPARVSIDKTFGGSFIDDYGEDNLEIIISGHSGTARAFPTYRTTNRTTSNIPSIISSGQVESSVVSELYDGRNAFYTFRNAIMRYRSREGFETKKLRVYDLFDEQGYDCTLLDFTLQRTAQSPFRYPYMIQLFVRERLDDGIPSSPPVYPRVRNVRELLSDVSSVSSSDNRQGRYNNPWQPRIGSPNEAPFPGFVDAGPGEDTETFVVKDGVLIEGDPVKYQRLQSELEAQERRMQDARERRRLERRRKARLENQEEVGYQEMYGLLDGWEASHVNANSGALASAVGTEL